MTFVKRPVLKSRRGSRSALAQNYDGYTDVLMRDKSNSENHFSDVGLRIAIERKR